MITEHADVSITQVAAAIAEPARARMLCSLMDGRARTHTELAVIAEVTTSTASVHLARLKEQKLVEVLAQGKHRYHRLADERVADTLRSLLTLADVHRKSFVPRTPVYLRSARTCYDHMAGEFAVALHDQFIKDQWLARNSRDESRYAVTSRGARELTSRGIDISPEPLRRRREACACLDWSERRPHVGGALGAAMLRSALLNKWLVKDPDSRALRVTKRGRTELLARFGVAVI